MKCSELIEKLEILAPQCLAEGWDNPGLIVGNTNADIKKILVALDATEAVIDEAIAIDADIIVTHHPMLFSSVKKITDETAIGRKILKLVKNDISHFAMHTNLDIAVGGTNDRLAEILSLCHVKVLSVSGENNGVEFGLGRIGDLSKVSTLEAVARILKKELGLSTIRVVGDKEHIVKRIGLCTGSGFEFMKDAVEKGADLYVTSDLRYHESQKALDAGICLIDATHYGSENIIVPIISRFLEGLNGDFQVVESLVNGQVFTDI